MALLLCTKPAELKIKQLYVPASVNFKLFKVRMGEEALEIGLPLNVQV